MSLREVNSLDPKGEEHILGIVVTLRMCKHADFNMVVWNLGYH